MSDLASTIELLKQLPPKHGFQWKAKRFEHVGSISLSALSIRRHTKYDAILCDIAVFYPGLQESPWRMPKKELSCHLLSQLGSLHPQFHPSILPEAYPSPSALVSEFDDALLNTLMPWVDKLDSPAFMKEHLDLVLQVFTPTSQAVGQKLERYFR
ncbi:MAG: hypothetical protein H6591_11645 [Flavobacteriales bacterium]|nr:hypothetical protein [Flavobacteriales bacterium]